MCEGEKETSKYKQALCSPNTNSLMPIPAFRDIPISELWTQSQQTRQELSWG